VGKTYAMLPEVRRRAGNGERVVANWIDWYGHHRSRLGELARGSVASRLRRLLPKQPSGKYA
jgi:K+-sensing histidine kinase KdpD